MPQDLGALALLVLVALVVTRARMLKKSGFTALKFGAIDKTDFVILPFALFFFYVIFAGALRPEGILARAFFQPPWVAWLGVAICAVALLLIVLSLRSFGTSFRVGIDTDRPGALVTSGVFAYTRNPMYVAFACLLLGEFLIQPSWIVLAYLLAATWLFHRQVLREEAYLAAHYGDEYRCYAERVRRYL